MQRSVFFDGGNRDAYATINRNIQCYSDTEKNSEVSGDVLRDNGTSSGVVKHRNTAKYALAENNGGETLECISRAERRRVKPMKSAYNEIDR